jgi:integrase
MRQRISKSAVDRLRPGESIADTNPTGFVARRLPSGAITYGYRYRDKRSGLQRWIGLGIHGTVTADQARKKAMRFAGEVRDGADPMTEGRSAGAVAAKRRSAANTVNGLLDAFIARHVRPNLRSAAEVERTFARYVRPAIGYRGIYDLRRADIVALLDAIEDNGAPVMADRTLAHLRKAFNWYASRDDQFTPPIVKGMARTKNADRARTRMLGDDEIRDLWRALDTAKAPQPFAPLVRMLLLTAQRREEVAQMSWPEVEGDTWLIPAERYKSGLPNAVPLTKAARALLGEAGTGFVFSTDGGKRPFSGFSKAKAQLDIAIAALRKHDGRKPMPAWRLHDLRRTARSLMSRAGVPADIGERCLGHVIGGVRGTYDRHDFLAEKRSALEKLGALIARILSPTETVVRFPKSG